MKIFIIGDSHIGALKYKYGPASDPVTIPDCMDVDFIPLGAWNVYEHFLILEKSDRIVVTDPHSKHLRVKNFSKLIPISNNNDQFYYIISSPLHSFSTCGLFQGNEYTLNPDIEKDLFPISKNVFEYIVKTSQRFLLELIDMLIKRKQIVFVIEPPRAFRSHQLVDIIGGEKVVSFTHTYRACFKGILEKAKVPTIMVPRETIDEDGFTLKEYSHPREDDSHHGNSEFGNLMMKKIIRAVMASSSG